jgi:hypothetical protein
MDKKALLAHLDKMGKLYNQALTKNKRAKRVLTTGKLTATRMAQSRLLNAEALVLEAKADVMRAKMEERLNGKNHPCSTERIIQKAKSAAAGSGR